MSTPSELRRRLAALAPKQQLDALIDQPDALRAVRSVPAEQLYTAILEVGLADATEIVQLASPEQFRAFVDLAGWRRDRLDPHQALTWLRAARGEEAEDFLAKLHTLDIELLELLLRTFTVIHDKEENPDVDPQGVTMEMPEGKYLIEFTVEGAELSAVRQLVSDLVAQDPFLAGRLIEAIRWELPSELEEVAYQFRTARLEDLGFPQLPQALELFTYVDSAPFAPARTVETQALAPSAGRVDYLEAALKSLDADEQDAVAAELRYLVNCTLVAEAAEPGELAAIRRVAEMARDYLNLGLEHVTGADPARGAETVREHPLKRLFQIGFSLTLALKFRVDRLAKEPLARLGDGWLALADEATALQALRRKRPLRALKVPGAEPVPFRNRRELDEAGATVDRAQRQFQVLRTLVGESQKTAQERVGVASVDRFFTGVAANALVDGRLWHGPVPAARLTELWGRLFEGDASAPALRASAVTRASEVLGEAAPQSVEELRRMVDAVFRRLAADLAPAWLSSHQVDPAMASLLLPIEGELGL